MTSPAVAAEASEAVGVKLTVLEKEGRQSVKQISFAQVEAHRDVSAHKIPLRSQAGSESGTGEEFPSGTSIAGLLALEEISAAQVTYVEVLQWGGGVSLLCQSATAECGEGGDLNAETSGFHEHEVPYLAINLANQLEYQAPERNNSQDVNGREHSYPPAGEPIEMRVSLGGRHLSIKLTAASGTSPAVGSPVRFSAQIAGAEGEYPLNLAWSFGDGTVRHDTLLKPEEVRVEHSWAAAGTAEVQLTVEGKNGGGGMSNAVHVQVGGGGSAESSGNGNGIHTEKGTLATGPRESAGVGNAALVSSSRLAAGTHRAPAEIGASGSPVRRAQLRPSAKLARPSARVLSSRGSVGGVNTGAAAAAQGATGRRSARARRGKPLPARSTDGQVGGRLIEALSPAAAAALGGVGTQPGGAAPVEGHPPLALTALGLPALVALLFLAGAGRELRDPRHALLGDLAD